MNPYPRSRVLDLFDRINLARCAMDRAKQNLDNNDRFTGEYMTARLWNGYRINPHG